MDSNISILYIVVGGGGLGGGGDDYFRLLVWVSLGYLCEYLKDTIIRSLHCTLFITSYII